MSFDPHKISFYNFILLWSMTTECPPLYLLIFVKVGNSQLHFSPLSLWTILIFESNNCSTTWNHFLKHLKYLLFYTMKNTKWIEKDDQILPGYSKYVNPSRVYWTWFHCSLLCLHVRTVIWAFGSSKYYILQTFLMSNIYFDFFSIVGPI